MAPGEETPVPNNQDLLPATGNRTGSMRTLFERDSAVRQPTSVPSSSSNVPGTRQSNLLHSECIIHGGLRVPNNSPERYSDGARHEQRRVVSRNILASIQRDEPLPPLRQLDSYVGNSRGVPIPRRSGRLSEFSRPEGYGTRAESWRTEVGRGEAWEWLQEHYLLNPISVGGNNDGSDIESVKSTSSDDDIFNASMDHTDPNPDNFEDGLRPCISLDRFSSHVVNQVPTIMVTDTNGQEVEEEVEETNTSAPEPYTLLEEFPRYQPQTGMILPQLTERCWGLQPSPQAYKGKMMVYNGPDPRFDPSGHLIEEAENQRPHPNPSNAARNLRISTNEIPRPDREFRRSIDPATRGQRVSSIQTTQHQHHPPSSSRNPRGNRLEIAPPATGTSNSHLPRCATVTANLNRQGVGVVRPTPNPMVQPPESSSRLRRSHSRRPRDVGVPGHTPCPDTDERLAGLYPTGSPSVFWERPTLLFRHLQHNRAGTVVSPCIDAEQSSSESSSE